MFKTVVKITNFSIAFYIFCSDNHAVPATGMHLPIGFGLILYLLQDSLLYGTVKDNTYHYSMQQCG